MLKLVCDISGARRKQLLEVEVFNIGGTSGGKVQTYYHIIRKVDLSGVKEI